MAGELDQVEPVPTIIVSHEQELLDGACSHMAEVRGRGLHWYTKLYQILEDRDERIMLAKATYEKQLAEEAELKDFIRGFSANASKSTQAQSRQKLLDKLQKEMRLTVSAATVTTTDGAAEREQDEPSAREAAPSNVVQLRMKDAVLGYDAQRRSSKVRSSSSGTCASSSSARTAPASPRCSRPSPA